MINLNYSNPSEARRRIVLIFVLLFLSVTILWSLVVYPLRNKASQLKKEIQDLDDEIGMHAALVSDEPLSKKVEQERRRNRSLENEWQKLKKAVQTFGENAELEDFLSSSEEGRIDYKVALYDARQRFEKKSVLHDLEFPEDMGMDEAIDTDEVMETKLWQLAADVFLMDRLIGPEVFSIYSIKTLDPIAFSLTAGIDSYMVLYPVKVEISYSHRGFLSFMDAIDQNQGFYALQRLMVERGGPEKMGILKVSAVCSALVFREELPRLEAPPEGDMIDEAYYSDFEISEDEE